MKTIDKAKELVIKFIGHNLITPNGKSIESAKNCALICVEAIIIETKDIEKGIDLSLESSIEYWNEVKNEIKKLSSGQHIP